MKELLLQLPNNGFVPVLHTVVGDCVTVREAPKINLRRISQSNHLRSHLMSSDGRYQKEERSMGDRVDWTGPCANSGWQQHAVGRPQPNTTPRMRSKNPCRSTTCSIFLIIFSHLEIPDRYQHRVLGYGVAGATDQAQENSRVIAEPNARIRKSG